MAKRKHRGGGSDRHSPRPGSARPRAKSAPSVGSPRDGKPRFGGPGAGPSGKRAWSKHPREDRADTGQRLRSADQRAAPSVGRDRDSHPRHGRPGRPHPARTEADHDTAAAAPPHRPAHGGPRQLWLYGLHAVRAALANPRRRRRRLVLSDEAAEALGRGDPGQENAVLGSAEILPREEIARLLPPGAVHQGAALLTEPLDAIALEDVLDAAAGSENGLVLVLDQVTDPQNVGAILRSAAAFGAAAVIVPDRHAPPETGALVKAASGAIEVVPLVRVVNLSRALEQLKAAGFWCAGLEGRAPRTLAAADLSGKVALVLGAEGEGLRRLTRDHCDILVRLPISERVESLNVSAAAAVALYELARKA